MRSLHFLVYTKYILVSRNTLHLLGVKVAKNEVCYMVKSPTVAKINSLLAEKGITKKQFYKDCGITSASFSLWNTGKTNPTIKNLKIIADYLGVSISDLMPIDQSMSLEDSKKSSPSTDNSAKAAACEKIISSLNDLSLDELSFLSAQLEVLRTMKEPR